VKPAECGLACELCDQPAIHADLVPDASVPGNALGEAGYRLQPLCLIHTVDRRQVSTSRVREILRCERQGIGRLDRGRVCGDCLCLDCNREYRRHPAEVEHPFLNVLCDGSVVKL